MSWRNSKEVREILENPKVQRQLADQLYNGESGQAVVLNVGSKRYRVIDVHPTSSNDKS